MNEWIEVIDYEGDAGELRKYGLGLGEASLLLAAKREDRLVLDETSARRFAESRGFQFTGLIGLLIAAVRIRKLTKERAVEVLNRLAKGDFRISSDLYLWAYEEIGCVSS
jgi:predicted nucleic acid-binding protein